jgi:peptidyl-prolyl cis-trans isomerase A (cyclophilin A)
LAGFEKTESGLRYHPKREGNKLKQEKQFLFTMVLLESGKVFDSSYPKPIEFTRSIEGWDEGIQLLRVGDKARSQIPSD